MKSATRENPFFIKLFTVVVGILCFGLLFHAESGLSETTDREFETELILKKRDFNQFLNLRLKSSEQEIIAARAHGEKRQEEAQIQKDLEASYRQQMKRYSMEEIEIKDRADEERLRIEASKVESSRGEFIARRDRHRELDRAIAPVDGNLEFEIDMNKEPDFKSSYPVDPLKIIETAN